MAPEYEKEFFDLGLIGGSQVALTACEMGANGNGGSFDTLNSVLPLTQPEFVIMVGIAWGNDSADIGDILISKELADYSLRRVGQTEEGDQKIVSRGTRVPGSDVILKRLKMYSRKTSQKVDDGLVVSGPELIDNRNYRDEILQQYPEALGGEMEGFGVYRACAKHKKEWLVVKAVCDHADGKKKEDKKRRQRIAAENAANFAIGAIEAKAFVGEAEKEQIQNEEVQTGSVNVPPLQAVYLYRPRLVSAVEKKFFDNASDRTRNKALVGGIGFGKKSVAVELLQSRRSKNKAGAIWLDCTNNRTLCETLYDAISLMGGIPPKNNRNLSKLLTILAERITAPDWEVVFADLKSVELAKRLSICFANVSTITTTTNENVAKTLGCVTFTLRPFTFEDSARLIQFVSGFENLSASRFKRLADICGYLPEPLSAASALLRRTSRWEDLSDSISRIEMSLSEGDLASRIKEESLSSLTDEERIRFQDLSVLEPGSDISESALRVFWNDLERVSFRQFVEKLLRNQLLYLVATETYRVNSFLQSSLNSDELVSARDVVEKVCQSYLEKFGTWENVPFDGFYERSLLQTLVDYRMPKKAKAVAANLLCFPNDLDSSVVRVCLKLLPDAHAKAHLLLSATDDIVVQQHCMLYLGPKAKDHAKRLVRQSRNETIQALCLHVLGEDAEVEARRLIGNATNDVLISVCLKNISRVSQKQLEGLYRRCPSVAVRIVCLKRMDDSNAKEFAREFIEETENPTALTMCLKILGQEAKPKAKALLSNHENEMVRLACLKIIGDRDKKFVRRFLRVSEKSDQVLCWCLNRLGDEEGAKDFARQILKLERGFQLICKALHTLGKSGLPEARNLLETNHDPRVLMTCLRMVPENEARFYARKILDEVKRGELEEIVAASCIKTLGVDATDDAREFLLTTTCTEVQVACVDLIGANNQDLVLKLLAKTRNEPLIQKCLKIVGKKGVEAARLWEHRAKGCQLVQTCQEIIREHSNAVRTK